MRHDLLIEILADLVVSHMYERKAGGAKFWCSFIVSLTTTLTLLVVYGVFGRFSGKPFLGEVGAEALEGLVLQQQDEVEEMRARGDDTGLKALMVKHAYRLAAEIAIIIWDRIKTAFTPSALVNPKDE